MADQWEMCFLSQYYTRVYFYTPKGVTDFSHKEFLQRYNPSFKSSGRDRSLVICKLLSDSWEPYAEDASNDYFRRKYQG